MAQKRPKKYKVTMTLPSGKRKYFYGSTAKEAEEKRRKARYELGLGIDLESNITFGELAEIWYNVYKKPRLKSPNSEHAVLNVLNNHLLPTLSPVPVRKVTTAQIQAVLNQMSGLSASLQNKTLQTMKSIFQMAVDEGLIHRSPVTMSVRSSGKPTEEKIPLTIEQENRLLEAVAGTNAETFVRVALRTGLRRGEILALQWDDIDLDRQLIHVRHNALLQRSGGQTTITDKLKTRTSRRDVPIPSTLSEYLSTLKRSSGAEYLIHMRSGEPMTLSAFRAMWRIISMRTASAGQPLGSSPANHPQVVRTLDFHVHPHLLRHTYITRLFDGGIDLKTVQYLAGHETPELTLRIYVHYLKSKKQEEAGRKIDELFREENH